jgi:hypothetical protein
MPEDISFIYSTWLRSYRTGSGLGLASGKHAYFLTYNQVIDHILDKDRTIIMVAAKPDEPDVIWGYMIAEPRVLHYVFVKQGFRRFGIAKALYQNHFGERPVVTHMTHLGREIIKTHPGFTFNVNLLFKGDAHGTRANPTGTQGHA